MSVGVIYLPPDRKTDSYSVNYHIESIGAVQSHLRANDHAILLGDYNQSGLVWNVHPDSLPKVNVLQSHISPACALLLDGFNFQGLTQINTIRNRNNRLLDFALVNETTLEGYTLSEIADPLSTLDADHPAFLVELSLSKTEVDELLDIPSLDFNRANYVGLVEALQRINWSTIDASADVDDAVQRFSRELHGAMAEHIPSRRPSPKPPWGNAHLRRLKKIRSKMLRRYCRSRCPVSKQLFNRASNNHRLYSRLLYKRYTIRTQSNLRRNPKQFWNFVNSKRKEEGLPVEMFLRNEVGSSAREKCNLFASHFRSAFNNTVSSDAQVEVACRDTPTNVCMLGRFQITPEHVKVAITKLKFSYTSPDGIPSCVFKKCSDALVYPLTLMFNASLRQCKFPTSWKSSVMFPVHKKDDKRNIEHYRGITSLCACSKIFEIVMNEALFESCKNYISPDQHGFFPRRSTSTNLVQFVSFCLRNLDSGAQVDAVYTDLKSAFDRVDHGILLARLEKLGLSHDLVRWFRSYLTDRQLVVRIGPESSEPFSSLSGVPQGSNLGPLLFSIFINELSSVLPTGCRLFYADDVKIYIVINCLQDCLNLQQSIRIFNEWCTTNMLTVSVQKCHVISFHRKRTPITFDYSIADQPLTRVTEVRDLGVILDTALTFRVHYNDVISRANRLLGFMFKIANEFRDPLCLRSLYCALVRSILESNVVVWCPYQSTWISRIEAIQRKFVRYALRNLPWHDPINLPRYEDRCRLLGIETLEQRRSNAQAVFVAKILLGELDSLEILNQIDIYAPTRVLRQRDFLRLGTRRTGYGSHDPIRFMSATFNGVYELFEFNISATTFKRRLQGRS